MVIMIGIGAMIWPVSATQAQQVPAQTPQSQGAAQTPQSQPPLAQGLQTSPPAHDPVMIRQDSVYYMFCTGFGISEWSSLDRKTWRQEKPIFAQSPK